MPRIILTFKTLHQLLAAEKSLKKFQAHLSSNREIEPVLVRPTPTPPGLSDSVCGMSLEILVQSEKASILEHLESVSLNPKQVHELIDD